MERHNLLSFSAIFFSAGCDNRNVFSLHSNHRSLLNAWVGTLPLDVAEVLR